MTSTYFNSYALNWFQLVDLVTLFFEVLLDSVLQEQEVQDEVAAAWQKGLKSCDSSLRGREPRFLDKKWNSCAGPSAVGVPHSSLSRGF